MSWLRRSSRPMSTGDDITVDRDPRPAQFVGFADPSPDLHEFTTAGGQHVSLHEGYLDSLHYAVGAPPTITVSFVFGGDEITSLTQPLRADVTDARVSLRFTDAYVLAWESSQEMPRYRSDDTVPHGQVDDVHLYARRCFCIATIDDTIYVEATGVEVSVESLPDDEVRRALRRVAGRGRREADC